MSTFHERKAERITHFERHVKGWKLETCTACNGSGYYDDDGSPDCGACDGTGKTRVPPPLPILYWGVESSRVGWWLKRGGKIYMVHGPSICVSSGGGVERAAQQVKDEGYLGPLEIYPINHYTADDKPCNCHLTYLKEPK